VVVHAAAGGAGLARQAGADEVVRYAEVVSRARELTDGAGVAAVYDGVGAATFDSSLAALRPGGTLVLFGSSSGAVPSLDPMRLASAGSLYLTRPTLVHYTASRAELLERAGEVFELVAAGRLDVRIGARYPLDQARRAHEDLEARRTTGKLLLLPR
jgi:NADPH2:quinone reductase